MKNSQEQSIVMNPRGFSTIIAILITAFLTVLSAGILNLIVTERATNAFLFDGISAYSRAEWALEYALLKGRNHREGFQDSITIDDAWEADLLKDSTSAKKTHIRYETQSSGKAYSGSIAAGGFEIIPLFYDRWVLISAHAKNPNKETTSNLEAADEFTVTASGSVAWNIIGNDNTGNTFGIAGTGGLGSSFGNATMGSWKESNSECMTAGTNSECMTAGTKSIRDFFLKGYTNNYLILSNPSTDIITYSIISPDIFSFPTRSIIASSRVGNSKQNIEFKEDRSRLFDMLKYSVFSNVEN